MVTQNSRWLREAGTPGLVRERKSGTYYLRRNFSLGEGRTRQVLRSLKTKDKAEALRRFALETGAVQREIEQERRDDQGNRKGKRATPEDVARHWRERLAADDTSAEAALDSYLDERLGEPVGVKYDEAGDLAPVYDPEREAEVRRINGLVSGRVVPVAFHLDDFLAAKSISVRYVSRFKRATTLLAEWLATRRETDNIRAVSEATASAFSVHLVSLKLAPKTIQSLLGALGVYWKWLKVQGAVTGNVWTAAERPKDNSDDKRPFTDEEVATLLAGPANRTLAHAMRIAALSGMRLNEIANLTVADCAEGLMRIRRAKTKAGKRSVPIHSALTAIMEERTKGKEPDAFLFDEMKAPPSRGENGRGDKTGERFTDYRRSLGVDETPEGAKQSLVDFHSFRRWFITAAEHAGQPPHVISAVVGHKVARSSMTLSVYSAGPSLEQRRAVVESVRLPTRGSTA